MDHQNRTFFSLQKWPDNLVQVIKFKHKLRRKPTYVFLFHLQVQITHSSQFRKHILPGLQTNRPYCYKLLLLLLNNGQQRSKQVCKNYDNF